MNEETKLVLEILSGPLDGAVITIREGTDWSSTGEGPLVFPWDEELGQPQARFEVAESGWQLEAFASPHGTYHLNENRRLGNEKIQLAAEDILKGSDTWLLVRKLTFVRSNKAAMKETNK